MRSESCWAPPSKRRSGPRSSVARNGVNGSPHRIQNNADNKDGGALLRANTPSMPVANMRRAAIGPTCAASHSCSVVASHSSARGAIHGASGGTKTSTPAAASNRAAYKPDRPPPMTTTSRDRCRAIRFLEPLQKVQVVAVRILQADHARAPRPILGWPRQHHAGLAKLGIERVDVGHREADMIDTGRIAEQTRLTAHRRRIGSPHLE